MKSSQKDRILRHLQTGRTLSPLEALNAFGTMRLAAHIFVLREEGHDIVTEEGKTQDGREFAIYRLKKKDSLF